MQQVHSGLAEFAGTLPLFTAPRPSISREEVAMSVLSPLRTSLLDLAGLLPGLFLRPQPIATPGKKGCIGR